MFFVINNLFSVAIWISQWGFQSLSIKSVYTKSESANKSERLSLTLKDNKVRKSDNVKRTKSLTKSIKVK